jgi:hypothetical protein
VREDGTRRDLFVVHAQPPQRRLHDHLLVGLVVDDEILGETLAVDLQRVNVAPQRPHAEGVEGGNRRLRQRASADEFVHALGHL